jgi:hypothetical protein
MYYKKFVRNILGSILIPCLLIITVVLIIDPLQVFHKSWFRPGKYCRNFRVGVLSVIKYVDFDSVILGSCLLQNTSSNKASKKLGGRFVNISFDGGTHYERSIILKKILYEKKNLKHVIFTVDPHFMGTKTAFSGTTLMDCEFLYDNHDISIGNLRVYLKYPSCMVPD